MGHGIAGLRIRAGDTSCPRDGPPPRRPIRLHDDRHGEKEWSRYDYRTNAWHHVNNVESFWHLFKHSVRGTHIHISRQHMNCYLNEFTFRSNHRAKENAMFDLLIGAV